MKLSLKAAGIIMLIFGTSLFAQDVFNGIWQGKLAISGQGLRIVFHISQDENGSFKATMDSPDQGARGIAVDEVIINETELELKLTSIGGAFKGTLKEDGQTIDGTWTQSGYSFPLCLSINGSPENAPQKKKIKAVVPYSEKELSILNEPQGNTIAGTLTFPKDKKRHPALILISGSGAQDRDETILGHKPFLVLADYLTRKGFAVFRYDDRGVNGSSGKLATSTLEDLSTDVLTIVQYLKKLDMIDTGKIGLLGHSEGGLVASLSAAEDKNITFVVLMASPGIVGSEVICDQVGALSKLAGLSPELVQKNITEQRKILDIVKQEKNDTIAAKKLEEVVPPAKHAQIKILLSAKYRSLISFDPASVLINVDCPVLALNGSKDIQVEAKKNLDAIAAVLQKGGNTDFQTKEIAGVNHLFQTAQTGAVSEYGTIKETLKPAVLEIINEWLKQKTGI